MERLDSSQTNQSVTGLEEPKTPVLTQELTPITTTDSHSDANPRTRAKRHVPPLAVLGVLLGAGAIASGIYAYRWWEYTAQKYPQTDNAYIAANIYSVTARIPGIVTDVAVNDNQTVSPGTVLVKLDPRDYQVALTQAKASLELAKQQATLARENLNAVATNPLPKLEPTNKNTQKPILNTNRILQTPINNQQTEINTQQYKTAQAAVTQKQAEVKTSELQLSYTNITALAAGKVGNKNVSVGERVQPGQTLITVVQPGPWIVANFKETQLEKIQPGQKVAIQIPAFPSQKFRGRVDSMSPTSFGKVAPVPQDNTTGNLIRNQDVQRIPVKIVLEPESIRGYESRFTPGMSASVTVETK